MERDPFPRPNTRTYHFDQLYVCATSQYDPINNPDFARKTKTVRDNKLVADDSDVP